MLRTCALVIGGILLAAVAGCDALPRFLAQEPPEPSLRGLREAREARGPENDAPERWTQPRGEHDGLPMLPAAAPVVLEPASDAWHIALPAMPTAARLTAASAGPVVLELLRAEGAIVQRFEAETADPALAVGPFRADGAWSLRVSGAQADVELRLDPVDGAVCGSLAPGGELSLHRPDVVLEVCTDLDEERVITVPWAVFADSGLFGVRLIGDPGLPVDLEVRDADDEPHARAEVSPGDRLLWPNIGRPQAPGPVRLALRARGGRGQVQVALVTPPDLAGAHLEREPNDTEAAAESVSPDLPIAGFLHVPGDVDVFRLQAAEGGHWRVHLEPRTSFSPELDVLGAVAQPTRVADEDRVTLCHVSLDPQSPVLLRVSGREVQEVPAAYRILFEEIAPGAWPWGGDPVASTLVEAAASAREARRAPTEEGDTLSVALGRPKEGIAPTGAPAGLLDADGDLVERVHGFHTATSTPRLLVLDTEDARDAWSAVTLRLAPGGPVGMELVLRDADGGLVARAPARSVGSVLELEADLPRGVWVVEVRGQRLPGRCLDPWSLSVSVAAAEGAPGGTPLDDERPPEGEAPPAPPARSFFD